jgi:hypothetical protein
LDFIIKTSIKRVARDKPCDPPATYYFWVSKVPKLA